MKKSKILIIFALIFTVCFSLSLTSYASTSDNVFTDSLNNYSVLETIDDQEGIQCEHIVDNYGNQYLAFDYDNAITVGGNLASNNYTIENPPTTITNYIATLYYYVFQDMNMPTYIGNQISYNAFGIFMYPNGRVFVKINNF